MDLTAEKIFHLFFKFPIQHIPIVSQGQIYSYISKTKTLREASSPSFFRVDLASVMEKILETGEENIFFRRIDEMALRQIPVVELEDLRIRFLVAKEFNARFRPVTELEASNFEKIVNELDTALLVINSKNQIIYKNKRVRELSRLLSGETGVKKKSLLDYFPKSFFSYLEEAMPGKVYSLSFSRLVIKYRIQEIILDRSTVKLVYFFN